ncbi:MAG: hypothetical protein ACI8ZB_002360 [Desulforhopalus sp.]|jgi:hypothetical protein
MSTFIWNLLLPVLMILSTPVPGAGWYYVDEPIDQVVELSALAGSGPFVAGTVVDYLPDGARSVTIENTQYFISSGNWFVAVFEGGIQYMVVLAPE